MFLQKFIQIISFRNHIDNVYTEDGILVRRIFIPLLRSDMNIETLRNRFSVFGEIESVVLKEKYNVVSGFVTFVHSQDAAKALKMKLLNAEPANSWRQPVANNSEHNAIKRQEYVTGEDNYLMLLNDDCILHILSYLSVLELTYLQAMCTRFSDIVNSLFRKHYRSVDYDSLIRRNNMTLLEKRFVLLGVGKFIVELSMSTFDLSHDKRLIKLIPRHCKNLEVLRLYCLPLLSDKFLKIFLPLFKQLKVLSITSSEISEDLFEKCLENAHSLLELEFNSNNTISGRFLTKIKNLTHLKIGFGINIIPECFTEFCVNNKTLKQLDIRSCEGLNGKNFHDIADNLINLECLSIDSYYSLCNKSDVCKLGNLLTLKKLILGNRLLDDENYAKYFTDVLLTYLVITDTLESIQINMEPIFEKTISLVTKFSKLKEFQICNQYYIEINEDLCAIASKGLLTHLEVVNCYYVTNAAILKCIELCPNLEFLNVTGSTVDRTLILKLPYVLKKRFPQKKITIYVYKNKFDEFLKNNQTFLLDNKDLFKILSSSSLLVRNLRN